MKFKNRINTRPECRNLPTGVTVYKRKFLAQATHWGKRHNLGLHKTVEEAEAAYLKFKEGVARGDYD